MENNFFPASNNNTATTATANNNTINTFTNQQLSQPNMAYTQNSQLYLPTYYHQNMQFPSTYPLDQSGGQSFAVAAAAPYPVYPFWLAQNGIQNGGGNNAIPAAAGSWSLQPNIRVPKEPQRVVLDPQKTKIARIKRKLARQKSLSLQRNASSGASSSNVPSSAHFDATRLPTYGVDTHRDLFNFCTPDNKRLRVLLQKALKNSDVGSLGRIILPKREAEENLPSLSDKEGIHIVIRDVYSDKHWTLKFKYWSNNKSRMYVLENTVDFVKQNGLEIGDSLTLYEDESKNLYFSVKKVERPEPAAEPSYKQQNYDFFPAANQTPTPIMHQARDEEEASLALLIEQLRHKEQQETYYNLMTLPLDDHEEANNVVRASNNATSSGIHAHLAATSSSSHGAKMNNPEYDHHQTVDDCYSCLDMLPDVDTYNFSI